MTPQALQLALFVLEAAIRAEPAVAAEIQNLLSKDNPTAEDWTTLRARIERKSYRDYVPASLLPPSA